MRSQLPARSLTEDAELVDATTDRFKGRDAINERIDGFSERSPARG
ncbi:MAG TPA: hypothetical protein VNT54_08090 [Solirubrobacteraceae bacterium]|nr:hypothetical protein [Solirubrobacteraceae bacterium]